MTVADNDNVRQLPGAELISRKFIAAMSAPRLDAIGFRAGRQALQLTQGELAKLFGVSRTTINGWEMAHTPVAPPAAILLRLILMEENLLAPLQAQDARAAARRAAAIAQNRLQLK